MQLTVLRSLALAMFGGVILTFSSCSNNDLVQDETKSTAVEKKEGFIIRKTKRNHLFKRSDKTRKTKCTFEESPFFLRLRTK